MLSKESKSTQIIMNDDGKGFSIRLWLRLMKIGKVSGCHQLPQRSFCWHGYQFPICARCTGVLVGNIAAYSTFLLYAMPLQFCLLGCATMFTDWFIQYIGLRESTNIRRLVTGIIIGYALTMLYCTAIKHGVWLLTNKLK